MSKGAHAGLPPPGAPGVVACAHTDHGRRGAAQVRYCGAACQKAHWNEHKEACKQARRQRSRKQESEPRVDAGDDSEDVLEGPAEV